MKTELPTETEIKDRVRQALFAAFAGVQPIEETVQITHTDNLVEMLADDEGFTDEPATEFGSKVPLNTDVLAGAL